MRIKINNNKVLNTINKTIESSDSFDIDKSGSLIIFDIKEYEDYFSCFVADGFIIKGPVLLKDIESLVVSNRLPYYILDENHILDKKKISLSNMTSLFTKDLSTEERGKIKEYNSSNYSLENRIIDYSQIDANYEDDDILLAKEIILKAKQILKEKAPFYFVIIKNLTERYVNPPHRVPTMAVSPNGIVYNTEFVKKTKVQELAFVLAHEASHIILNHLSRLKDLNPEISNLAGDLIINKILCKEFGIKPSQTKTENFEFAHGGVYSDYIDEENDSLESIYEELVLEMNNSDNQKENNTNSNNNSTSILEQLKDIIFNINDKIMRLEDNKIRDKFSVKMAKLEPNINKTMEILSKE